jgi:Bacterial Ig-like domain (group 2)
VVQVKLRQGRFLQRLIAVEPDASIDIVGPTQQQENRARQAIRLLLAGLAAAGLVACRDDRAAAARPAVDTPALLRVIARSHGEYMPPPATADDRRRRAEWSSARPARRRRVEPSVGAIDSVAWQQPLDTAPPAGPMHSIRIVPDTATLRVGERTTLALEALDSTGRRTRVALAQWRPDDAEVVTLDRSGVVTARAPGTTRIEAWVGQIRTQARIDVLPVIRGRLLTIDGQVPAGMQVRFVAGGFADSLAVGEDGRFEFRPPTTYADTGELWIRPVDPTAGDYHPMVARVTARETGRELAAVLVPTRWAIRSGTFAGATRGLSADAALRRWRGTPSFARSAAHAGRRTRRVVGWPPDAFPLPVAFVREQGTAAVSAADSTAFWDSVRRLETQLGMTLFRPADSAALGDGRRGVEVVIDPRVPPAAVTWASWVSSGDLNDARVAVRTPGDLRNAALIGHEMLHALGFGHAMEWRSVMTRTALASVTALTPEDVAYVQLIHRVRGAQVTLGAELGFLEAAEGERRSRAVARGYRAR